MTAKLRVKACALGVCTIIGVGGNLAYADRFTDPLSWDVFDAKDAPLSARGGYVGAVFDGRYVYFTPTRDTSDHWHGEFLRLDTADPDGFMDPGSWTTYDVAGEETTLVGYHGGVFDGERYIYFVPNRNGSTGDNWHAIVLRLDTVCDGAVDPFTDAACWQPYDAQAIGAKGGYQDAVFDGEQYIYFSPNADGPGVYHGEVLRFDTLDPEGFTDNGSWMIYEPAVGQHSAGYIGCAYDGRFVYFSPYYDGTYHGEVLRYDTLRAFDAPGSWAAYDYSTDPDGCAADPDCNDPVGYTAALFDGCFVYFAPMLNSTADAHGEVLRYDTTGNFDDPASWQTYDYGADPDGCAQDPECDDPDGYNGLLLVGNHLYFVPYRNYEHHGEVLRYNVTADFKTASSWATYDYGDYCVPAETCTDPDGDAGAASDGRFVYFAPNENTAPTHPHGEVLRYDTGQGVPTVSEWGLILMGLLGLTAGTLLYRRRCPVQA